MNDNVIKIRNFAVTVLMFILKCAIYFSGIVVLTGVIAYHWPKNLLFIPVVLFIGYPGDKFVYSRVFPAAGVDEININLTRGLIEIDNMIVPFNAIRDISTKRFVWGILFWTYNLNFQTNVIINLKDGTKREFIIGNLYDARRFIDAMKQIVPVHSS